MVRNGLTRFNMAETLMIEGSLDFKHLGEKWITENSGSWRQGARSKAPRL